MAKSKKSTKKFVQSGQLKKTIEARKKHQQIKKKIQGRRGAHNQKGNQVQDEEIQPQAVAPVKKPNKSKMSVDDLLNGAFMNDDDDDDEEDEELFDVDADDEGLPSDDAASFASLDEYDEGKSHLHELCQLASKDPEFFKYLQENDKELLDFDPSKIDVDEDDAEFPNERSSTQLPVLTKDIIRRWQKSLLDTRSLRALRKLLLAFRSAVHMNEEDVVLAWRIDEASVYNKLITTALKYTPVVLEHHVPFKVGANGKIKPPTQTPKYHALQKLILSFFHNALLLLSQLPSSDSDKVELAVNETAKLIPYIVSSRKSVKVYLKKLLTLFSSSPSDTTRIAAFLAIRKLAVVGDEGIVDFVLKNTYLTLLRTSKSTNPHTLPAITMMKNLGAELFCLESSAHAAYQHAFGYIRQLAIHLRNCMKLRSKDTFKQVYNWQYAHSVDFWCSVIALSCSQASEESELKALVYPLVQVSLGAVKLISNPRSHPFHLQILRSLLHLSKNTETYIPLAPYLLPIISSSSSAPAGSSKGKPLDLNVTLRGVGAGVREEAVYVLGEWIALQSGSIAFPEICVPLTTALRRHLKNGKGKEKGKGAPGIKTLVERIEENVMEVEKERRGVKLDGNVVEDWKVAEKEGAVEKYVKVLRKTREKRRILIEKARKGEGVEVREDDEDEEDEDDD